MHLTPINKGRNERRPPDGRTGAKKTGGERPARAAPNGRHGRGGAADGQTDVFPPDAYSGARGRARRRHRESRSRDAGKIPEATARADDDAERFLGRAAKPNPGAARAEKGREREVILAGETARIPAASGDAWWFARWSRRDAAREDFLARARIARESPREHVEVAKRIFPDATTRVFWSRKRRSTARDGERVWVTSERFVFAGEEKIARDLPVFFPRAKRTFFFRVTRGFFSVKTRRIFVVNPGRFLTAKSSRIFVVKARPFRGVKRSANGHENRNAFRARCDAKFGRESR